MEKMRKSSLINICINHIYIGDIRIDKNKNVYKIIIIQSQLAGEVSGNRSTAHTVYDSSPI